MAIVLAPFAVLAAVAVWLALAAQWWTAGGSSPIAPWAALAGFLLIPAAVAAAVLAVVGRRSWPAAQALAWTGAVVAVPGFVAIVETTGVDVYC